MPKELLIEFAESTNVTTQGNRVFVEGCFARSELLNKNGRRYTESGMNKAMREAQGKIASKNLFMTLGHGDSSTVNPSHIVGVVKSLKQHRRADGGSDWHGKSEILDSGMGKIARSILRAGGKLGASTKSSGRVRKDQDGTNVVEEFTIHSVDLICQPSIGEAGMLDAIYESLLESSAEETLNAKAQTLSDDKLARKTTEELTDIALDILRRLHPEAANNKYALNFDDDVQPYTNPNFPRTFTQQLEKDRSETIRKLLGIGQNIIQQEYNNGLLKDIYAAYAKKISQTSNPYKKSSLRREAQNVYRSSRVISEAKRFLSRKSPFDAGTNDTAEQIAGLRRNAGSKITKTPMLEETRAISNYHRKKRS
jgi:hypothetical protein